MSKRLREFAAPMVEAGRTEALGMAPRTANRSLHLCEMMARLGIELSAEALPRLALRYPTARRRCEACQSKEACGEWLAGVPTTASLAPGFCGNADILS